MEPLSGPPRRDDDGNAWLPFVIIAALIVLLFLSLIIVFRRDDEVEKAAGSLPESFDSLTVPLSTTTTTSTVPPTSPPPIVVPTTEPSGSGSNRTEPPGESTTVPVGLTPTEALARTAEQAAATVTSEVVPIGSDLYAMIVVHGRGQLLRWTSQQRWVVADRLDPPGGAIRDIKSADVTGDGVQDFVIFLGGLGQPGGVYSRATFTFGLLPFNTLEGKEDFVDGLDLHLGKLTSPFRDSSGSRTLTWTWTGEMFETR